MRKCVVEKRERSVFFIIVTFVLMILGIQGMGIARPQKVLAATRTQAEAVSWAQEQVGKQIDTDNGYPAGQPYQCVDLIRAYYEYLGATPASGNGADYRTNDKPDTWQRIPGAAPQPGDILIYTTGEEDDVGHVAIYESEYVTYHQNFNNHPYIEKVTDYRYDGLKISCWGVIRPDFSPFTIKNGVLSQYTGNEQDVVIPEGVVEVDGFAFRNKYAIRSITFPSTVQKISGLRELTPGNLENFYVAEGNEYYKAENGILYDFYENTLLRFPDGKGRSEKVTVFDNALKISEYAFTGCSVREISFVDSIKEIEDNAFYECDWLSKIQMPPDLEVVGANAFGYCRRLTDVEWGTRNKIATIGYCAFISCESLKKIDVPESVTALNADAFEFCENLEEINVAKNNTKYISVDNVVFTKDMKAMLIFPEGKGGSYSMPEGVVALDYGVMGYNRNITEVNIPSTLKCLAASSEEDWDHSSFASYGAFGGYTNASRSVEIQSINVDEKNPYYCSVDGVLFNKALTTLIEYPVGRGGTFTVPDTVVNIPNAAFRYNNLVAVTIPKSVKWIYSDNRFASITGYAGTAAQSYANKNNIQFIALKEPYPLGDANGDTKVNSRDALQCLRYSAEIITLTDTEFTRADVTRDNKVNSRDALQILRHSAEIISEF